MTDPRYEAGLKVRYMHSDVETLERTAAWAKDQFEELRPEIAFGVPRVWEKLKAGLETTLLYGIDDLDPDPLGGRDQLGLVLGREAEPGERRLRRQAEARTDRHLHRSSLDLAYNQCNRAH